MGAIIVGFTMEGGKLPALIQIAEFIILGGAGLSSLLASTSPKRVAAIMKDIISLLKPDPFTRNAYAEMLQLLYEVTDLSRKQGLLALEPHLERPEESDLLQQFPTFVGNHHAVSFLCDSLRLVLIGGVGTHELAEMMDGDIESHTEEVKRNPTTVGRVGDAMPGFGIVAAVLGVVVTMQSIGGPPEKVGEKVGAALVGTFLGILMCYGVFQPISVSMETRAESSIRYLTCLKAGIIAFAQGLAPMMVVEFARRNIESEERPTFQEMDGVLRGRSMATSDTEREAA
jgi:chemotaxis protein MotA